mmetsp:Transcript_42278/g.128253  ORF Transcript_42278/g.128253 Transcript_42278/m.128253 type:complete len:235 (-) Transcript_42278:1605-2309(-)
MWRTKARHRLFPHPSRAEGSPSVAAMAPIRNPVSLLKLSLGFETIPAAMCRCAAYPTEHLSAPKATNDELYARAYEIALAELVSNLIPDSVNSRRPSFSARLFMSAFTPAAVTLLKPRSSTARRTDVRTTAHSCAPRSLIRLLSSRTTRSVGEPQMAFMRLSTPAHVRLFRDSSSVSNGTCLFRDAAWEKRDRSASSNPQSASDSTRRAKLVNSMLDTERHPSGPISVPPRYSS